MSRFGGCISARGCRMCCSSRPIRRFRRSLDVLEIWWDGRSLEKPGWAFQVHRVSAVQRLHGLVVSSRASATRSALPAFSMMSARRVRLSSLMWRWLSRTCVYRPGASGLDEVVRSMANVAFFVLFRRLRLVFPGECPGNRALRPAKRHDSLEDRRVARSHGGSAGQRHIMLCSRALRATHGGRGGERRSASARESARSRFGGSCV
jgi:hypothetical protein